MPMNRFLTSILFTLVICLAIVLDYRIGLSTLQAFGLFMGFALLCSLIERFLLRNFKRKVHPQTVVFSFAATLLLCMVAANLLTQ